MRIAVIDNYDSFVYNLVHLLTHLGAEVDVWRNDSFELSQLAAYDGLLLSPGPGLPREAGLLLEVVRHYAGRLPILGVCLGQQAIAEAFGGQLRQLPEVRHGIATPCHCCVDDEVLFRHLSSPFWVGRYHSWVVEESTLPTCLEATALTEQGEIMALRHRWLDVRAVQFHPESILTPQGEQMLRNWMKR